MDATNEEQTELLRNIWRQMGDVDRNLSAKIDDVAAELKADIAGVKHDVAGLKHDVAGLKHDVAELKHDVAELKHDVAGLKHDMIEVRHDIDDIKLEQRAFRVAMDEGFSLLARGDARQDRELGELRGRVDRVEDHVGDPK